MSDTGKETPTMVEEVEGQTQKNDTLPELSLSDEDSQPYHMSWRTGVAVLSLSVLFGVTTFAITGPNFAISSMVETFPAGAKNAVWIADAGLIAAVSIPNMVGPTSDRYGKKWFLVIGAIIGLVGAVIAGKAKNLNIIVVGQAIGGLGSSMAIVTVPAGMEVVPAKYRPMVFAIMATFNGLLGAVAGPFVCEFISLPYAMNITLHGGIQMLLVSSINLAGSTDGAGDSIFRRYFLALLLLVFWYRTTLRQLASSANRTRRNYGSLLILSVLEFLQPGL